MSLSWMKSLMAAGLVLVTSVVQGQEITQTAFQADMQALFAHQAERMEALEAELAAIRSRADDPVGCTSGTCGTVCRTKCRPTVCCKQPCGLVGGFEAAILEVHQGSTVVNAPGIVTRSFSPDDYQLEFSPRVWVGMENCNGLGVRARYWEYDRDISTRQPGLRAAFEIEARAIDLEVTQTASLCGWQFDFAAGVRYAEMMDGLAFRQTQPLLSFLTLMRDFDGIGPTFAVGVRRPLGCCGRVAVVAGLRGSLLFGDTDVQSEADILLGDEVPVSRTTDLNMRDHLMQIWEINVGGEFVRPIRGGRLFARAVLEAQVWEWGSAAANLLDSDIGFFGPSFAVGLDR